MSRSLDALHPQFRPLVDLWLADMHKVALDPLITCTDRSGEEQDALWAIGRTLPGKIRTYAKAGQSAHNYSKDGIPMSLAIDFTIIIFGKPDWSGEDEPWNRAINLAKARGLQSLRPMESCHLQHSRWREIAGVSV